MGYSFYYYISYLSLINNQNISIIKLLIEYFIIYSRYKTIIYAIQKIIQNSFLISYTNNTLN